MIGEIIRNNENNLICSACNGKCCRNMGCHYSPEDFEEITTESILSILGTGNVSIDWWEGDILDKNRDQVYYLRVRNVGCGIIDGSWGGIPCKLLREHGCSLPFDKRPKGGRGLIPDVSFNCKDLYSKQDCAIEWYPYQHIMDEVISHIRYAD